MTITSIILIAILAVLAIIIIILVFRLGKNKEDVILHQKLDSFSGQLNQLYEKIGSLDRDSTEILNLTKSFNDILKPTKARGVVGEIILENLLKDVLPDDVIISQHRFNNGKTVDFAIKLPAGIVPIDAKFSVDTFQNYLNAPEQEKGRQKKLVIDGIKKRIDETSEYIFPDEGTTDFSLMYVPSEAVYYFIITESSLVDYANKRRVFITGPNTLYAYLKTILVGFQAMKIEKQAKEIYNNLRRLDNDITAVLEEYSVLGTHLKNTSAKYDDVRRKIEGISLRLSNISKDETKGKSNS